MNIIQKTSAFFKDAISEMKKVTWPTKKEATKNTLIVIMVCIAVAIFLGGIDFLFNKLIEEFII